MYRSFQHCVGYGCFAAVCFLVLSSFTQQHDCPGCKTSKTEAVRLEDGKEAVMREDEGSLREDEREDEGSLREDEGSLREDEGSLREDEGPPWFFFENDIVLVILFKHAYYERIPLLDQHYSWLFPRVLYTGPKPNGKVIYCPEGRHGQRAYACIPRAIKAEPERGGYLVVHFDLVFSWRRLQSLDPLRVWFINSDALSVVNTTSVLRKTYGAWTPWSHLLSQAKQMRAVLPRVDNCSRTRLAQKTESPGLLLSGYSDIVYLPARVVPAFDKVQRIFRENGVFHGIALPSIVYAIETCVLPAHPKLVLFGLPNLSTETYQY
eukprot:TRINITY_DN493_c0_g1_i1.p1 TRINITY_DN493_c0_g1~~TRINITY_DN493_c0_g1_i1.p1  ORF type:complete len:371 (+),score=47.79 TRINITY_DN493_c0_g1_i1:152-1114(+)